jgi:hypothetical protein
MIFVLVPRKAKFYSIFRGRNSRIKDMAVKRGSETRLKA